MAWRPATLLLVVSLASLAFAQETAPQRVQVDRKQMAEQIVKKVDPVYPPLAKQARIQGTVALKVVISKTGDVENVQLISGHPMLASAAIEAVRQWEYNPYLLNGEPIEVETKVMVNFSLAGEPPAEGTVGDTPGGSNTPVDADHPAIPGRVRISSGVASGLVVSKVPPQYPPDARDQRIQGVVVLRAVIDKEGNVANLQLISGHPALAPAAIDAVKQWKYRPYLLNGDPVEVETQIQVNFTLMN